MRQDANQDGGQDVVICSKFGRMGLVNLIILRDVSVNGMVSLEMKMDRKVWKKYISERIQEVGRAKWVNKTEREKEFVKMKKPKE